MLIGERFTVMAPVQIRNYGTAAGNICQADPFSDIIPALIVFGAKLELSDSKGDRVYLLEDFFLTIMKLNFSRTKY